MTPNNCYVQNDIDLLDLEIAAMERQHLEETETIIDNDVDEILTDGAPIDIEDGTIQDDTSQRAIFAWNFNPGENQKLPATPEMKEWWKKRRRWL
jgi:hypothetical protein